MNGTANRDGLTLTAGKCSNRFARIPDMNTDMFERMGGLLPHGIVVDNFERPYGASRFASQVKISGDAHEWHECQILIYGFNAQFTRRLWGINIDRSPLKINLSIGWSMDARQYFDKR